MAMERPSTDQKLGHIISPSFPSSTDDHDQEEITVQVLYRVSGGSPVPRTITATRTLSTFRSENPATLAERKRKNPMIDVPRKARTPRVLMEYKTNSEYSKPSENPVIEKTPRPRPRPRRGPSTDEALPDMPAAMRDAIVREFGREGGLSGPMTLLLQKTLFKTDVEKAQNRLSMPLSQLICAASGAGWDGGFLTAAEEARLGAKKAGGSGSLYEGIEVAFVDPAGRPGLKMDLKKWYNDRKTSCSYTLVKNWSAMAELNGLEAGHVVQVWFFRDCDGNPCFALVNLSKECEIVGDKERVDDKASGSCSGSDESTVTEERVDDKTSGSCSGSDESTVTELGDEGHEDTIEE